MSPNGQRNLFQKGHKKSGGRKKGVPNKMSGAQKQAMIDAAEVIGLDGHGLGGLVGYLARQAIYHPAGFFRLLTRDLRQQQAPIKHTLDFRRLTADEVITLCRIVDKASTDEPPEEEAIKTIDMSAIHKKIQQLEEQHHRRRQVGRGRFRKSSTSRRPRS